MGARPYEFAAPDAFQPGSNGLPSSHATQFGFTSFNMFISLLEMARDRLLVTRPFVVQSSVVSVVVGRVG